LPTVEKSRLFHQQVGWEKGPKGKCSILGRDLREVAGMGGKKGDKSVGTKEESTIPP